MRASGWFIVLVAAAVCAGAAAVSNAAYAESNMEVWSDTGVRVRVRDNAALTLRQQIRVDQSGDPWRILTELRGKVSTFTWLRLGGSYRAEARRRQGDTRWRHRFAIDGRMRLWRWSPLRLQARVRLQETAVQTRDGWRWDHGVRNRLRLILDLKDVEVFASIELFAALDGDGISMGKWRSTAGATLPAGNHDIEVFYRFDREMSDADTHIIGLSHRYDLR